MIKFRRVDLNHGDKTLCAFSLMFLDDSHQYLFKVHLC
jgi:hypothetical protein